MTEIVAEISGNHGGALPNALRLIAEAKKAGCDAVKFQCFEPGRLATKREPILGRTFEDLLLLYRQTHTPRPWFPLLIAKAFEVDIPWFSSVFDWDDVRFLEKLKCPRYKISAHEMLDGDLIHAVVATGKPIVMSVRPRPGLTILHATEYNGAMLDLGISDHGPHGWHAEFNCPMLERHLRLPNVYTPDKEFSSTPEEMAEYVRRARS